MKSDRARLKQAKKHLRELEAEIQRIVDRHPRLSQRQVEGDPKLRRLFTRADNAERIVHQLESKIRKRL
jgi:hypothetical protein